VLLIIKVKKTLHHLRHFLLFTCQNAFLVQTCFMSSKHLRLSSFGENHVFGPYLAQIVCRSTNETQNTWFAHLHKLFTSQNVFLVQLCFMTSKHIRICLFGDSLVSKHYLVQRVCRSTNQTLKILDLDNWCLLWAQISHYCIRNVKQTYIIYVIYFY
jgi:hypothetical protein